MTNEGQLPPPATTRPGYPGRPVWCVSPVRLPQLPELVARKTTGGEAERLPAADVDFHERERARLETDLRAAQEATALPDAPPARDAVHDWLVRVRLAAA